MKLSIRVETTSSTSSFASSQPGTQSHAAPKTAAMARQIGIRAHPRPAGSENPATTAASPAIRNAPSTPTLNTPARKQIAVPTAVNRSGVAAESVEAKRRSEPKASVAINAKVSMGLSPITRSTRALTISAISTGTANPKPRSNQFVMRPSPP